MKSEMRNRVEELAGELAAGVKDPADLRDLNSTLLKLTLEKILSEEMEAH